MMRFILCALLALGLAACGSAPEKTQALMGAAQVDPIESFAVGTLAPIGTFEYKAAPAYTKLAMLRHNAAKKLRAGDITVQAAIDLQTAADGVRALLDAAVRDDAQGRNDAATTKLIAAGVQLFAAESALENAQVQK